MFSILSLSTEIIFWVCGFAGLILTVYYWDKVAQKKWHHITARFSMVIAIQMFVLAAMGVTINRSGDFYDSWADLLGAKQQLAKIALSPQDLALISNSDIAAATKTTGGSLIFRKVIRGAQSNISDVVYVIASPKLAKLLESPTRSLGSQYQVDELFPGAPGVPQTWIGTLDGVTSMETLENAGQIGPTLLVIPAINVVPGQDTECMNFDGGAQVETWITSDMQNFMQKFMGIDNRPWGAFGYSTGGWCAAEAAILHQSQYYAAVSLAGYFQPEFSLGVTKREKNYLTSKYDLESALKNGQRNTKMLVIASVKDKFANASAKQFINSAQGYIPIKYIPIPVGGHNTSVWKPFVPTGFLWLGSEPPTNAAL